MKPYPNTTVCIYVAAWCVEITVAAAKIGRVSTADVYQLKWRRQRRPSDTRSRAWNMEKRNTLRTEIGMANDGHGST